MRAVAGLADAIVQGTQFIFDIAGHPLNVDAQLERARQGRRRQAQRMEIPGMFPASAINSVLLRSLCGCRWPAANSFGHSSIVNTVYMY
ncbi:hypothetical protein [Cupriavidus necator]|uniref:hypothetical protein n=1 Tax=Cupriavidus necator TaxID=106590 RepID=UPI0030F376D0